MKYKCKFDLDSISEQTQERSWRAKFWLDSMGIPYEEEHRIGHRYAVAELTKKQFKELCSTIECEEVSVYF